MDSSAQDEYLNTNGDDSSVITYCEKLRNEEIFENSEMTGTNPTEYGILPRRETEIEDMDSTDLLRLDKRKRETDREELWTTIIRKGKRFARSSLNEDSTAKAVDKTEVSITSDQILPKQFKLAKLFQDEHIRNIFKVKYINAYKVLIQFNNEESAYKLIDSQSFKEKGFKCQSTFELANTFGVIKDIDIDTTEEELLKSIECDKVIVGIKRLKRRNGNSGKWETSECVRLCFEGSALPKNVYIHNMITSVHPYMYPVTQCSRCWRFGHSLKMCPSNKVICPKCTDFHVNCETTNFKCNNCAGRHMSLSRTCPVYKKEKRIRELMSEFNCTYKQALRMFVPPEPITLSEDEPNVASEEKTNGENSIIMDSQMDITYADVLKTAHVNTVSKKKQINNTNKRNEKQKVNRQGENLDGDFNAVGEMSSEGETDSRLPMYEESLRTAKAKTASFQKLWEQLKDMIWNKKLNLELKFKECVKIIFEWIKSTLLHYLTQLPFLSHIKSWITNLD